MGQVDCTQQTFAAQALAQGTADRTGRLYRCENHRSFGSHDMLGLAVVLF
jgi:hypothetical protein